MNICVYCASSEKIDSSFFTAGEHFGESLAEKGHTLVFGAGKFGLMGAAARGCKRKGGNIIGIIPKFFENIDVMFTDCKIIKTDTMRERKRLMEEISDGFVMMPGGIGTFEEFFEILTLKQLDQHKKPIAVYNVNGYYDDMLKMLNTAVENRFMSKKCLKLFFVSDSEAEILNYFENYIPFNYNKYENERGVSK